MSPAADDPGRLPGYRFGPLQRQGLVAGWRTGQVLVVAAALVVAVAALRAAPNLAGAAGALAAVAGAAFAVTWPVAGRSLDQWCPDLLRHGAARLLLWLQQQRPAPFTGVELVPVTLQAAGRPAATGGAPAQAGILVDRLRRTHTAVVVAAAGGFVLGGPDEQHDRVAGWAQVLASVARQGTAVHRLQWIERCLPGAGAADLAGPPAGAAGAGRLEAFAGAGAGVGDLADLPAGAGADLPAGAAPSAARRSYRQLRAQVGSTASHHEVLLALTVRTPRRRPLGPGRADGHTCAVLLQELAALRRVLAHAQVTAGPVLDAAGVAGAIRRGFAPGPAGASAGAAGSAGTSMAAGSAGTSMGAGPRRTTAAARCAAHTGTLAASGLRVAGPRPAPPWPSALRPGWATLQVDGTWHATYWVAEWPRLDVGPDFLVPLVAHHDVRRSLSLVMEPVPPLQAARRAAQARTAHAADSELRRRGGFTATVQRARQQELLAQREAELADGHRQFRFSAYLTVTADDADALQRGCAQMEQVAGQAGLELRRCYGDQTAGFCSTLPLGRGLS